MIDLIVTLIALIALQAVLGFDNLLYISLESKRAPLEKQKKVRQLGIGLAIILRIILLFALMLVVKATQEPLGEIGIEGIFHANFNVHSIIVLVGGAFIIYTATKEVLHMIRIEDDHSEERKPTSAAAVITMIVIMNAVFSFDSILSAMALSGADKVETDTAMGMLMTKEFLVMVIAIVVSGILMIVMAEKVSEFLQKNRMYEVLGLFILFVVGIMLLSEGGHLAHMSIFGNEITVMTKGTFYLVIVVLVITDLVQTRYQKKILAEAAAKAQKLS